jgi:hypothetical protein
MNPRRLILAVGWLVLPVWVAAQTVNLAEMKKEEELRRQKTQKSKIVVSDANINSIQIQKTGYGFIQLQPGDVTTVETPVAAPAKAAEGGEPAPTESAADYWRSQRESLESRIAELEKSIATDEEELNNLQFQFNQTSMVTEQLTLNQQMELLRKQRTADQSALEEARQALEDLADRARKEGLPRSWMR